MLNRNTLNFNNIVPSSDFMRGKSIRYNFKWDPNTEYLNNDFVIDFVSLDGVLYACKKTNINQPITNTEYWDFVMEGQKGSKGDKGDKGDTGTLYLPSIDSNGNISWSNNGGLNNPKSVNIKGSKGDKGDKGDKGNKGDKGDKGDIGLRGKGIVYKWTDSKLGIKLEDAPDSEYKYVDLIGPQGIRGKTGIGQQGEKGDRGPAIIMSVKNNKLGYWADNEDASKFKELLDLTTLKGDKGDKGDSIIVEQDPSTGKVYYRHESEPSYTKHVLIETDQIKGVKGDPGDTIEKTYVGTDGYLYIKLKNESLVRRAGYVRGDKGADGREIILRVGSDEKDLQPNQDNVGTHIQWKYKGDEYKLWSNVIQINELMNIAMAGLQFTSEIIEVEENGEKVWYNELSLWIFKTKLDDQKNIVVDTSNPIKKINSIRIKVDNVLKNVYYDYDELEFVFEFLNPVGVIEKIKVPFSGFNYKYVTYDELYTLKNDSKLVTGTKYLITDYQTIYTENNLILGDNSSLHPSDNYRMVVTALDNHNLDSYVKILEHPEWIVRYDIEGDITEDRGKITYLKDEFNNEGGYDFYNRKWYKTRSELISDENPQTPLILDPSVIDAYIHTFAKLSSTGVSTVSSNFNNNKILESNNLIIISDSIYNNEFYKINNSLIINSIGINNSNLINCDEIFISGHEVKMMVIKNSDQCSFLSTILSSVIDEAFNFKLIGTIENSNLKFLSGNIKVNMFNVTNINGLNLNNITNLPMFFNNINFINVNDITNKRITDEAFSILNNLKYNITIFSDKGNHYLKYYDFDRMTDQIIELCKDDTIIATITTLGSWMELRGWSNTPVIIEDVGGLKHELPAGKFHKQLDVTNGKVNIIGDLTQLDCSDNYYITSLDLSKNVNLTELECWGNKITYLDLSKNVNLTFLNCNHNLLTYLDLSKNVKLTLLDCNSNQLTSLSVNKNINLSTLHCDENNLAPNNLIAKAGMDTSFWRYNPQNNGTLTIQYI